jgi:hypothetical protein
MAELIWHTETRHIADLKQYHKNPRKLSKERYHQLKMGIERFGLIDKPFINLDDTIIGGHQRILILANMGRFDIEVQVPNRMLDDREMEELNYRHNENTGQWDYDILANQYNLTDLLAWGSSPLDFMKDEPEPKRNKPKVIFEFESEAVMDEQATLIEQAALTWNAKMKIKK